MDVELRRNSWHAPSMKTLLLLLLAAIAMAPLALAAWSQAHSAVPGVVNDALAPCPDSPNCVCSCSKDSKHAIDPLPAAAGEAAAMDRLAAVIKRMDGATVANREGSYMHAVFVTPVFRFMDDAEFLYDAQAGAIQVRSASRVGYSDFGKNRERVEQLRALLDKAG